MIVSFSSVNWAEQPVLVLKNLDGTFIQPLTVAFYSVKGWQWDQLFPYVLGAGGLTSVMTACIAVANKIIGLKEKEGESNNEV